MGRHSHIEWTHHTFNPWWGCAKVSPACNNCYAESWAKRVGCDVWGSKAERRFFSDKHWKEPENWNEAAISKGVRERVFCASMSDVFESRTDLNAERKKLWSLIEKTPSLDWLLLTKRPQNIAKQVPWGQEWPQNVWIGTTVENQEWAEKRLPHLLALPAAVRFLSCEPLLGTIDLSQWVGKAGLHPIDWVIAGGESGAKSRPMKPEWARSLRDFCAKSGIAFHFKQWGHWIPEDQLKIERSQSKLKKMTELKMVAVGKKESGRVLDGKTHDGLPKAICAA